MKHQRPHVPELARQDAPPTWGNLTLEILRESMHGLPFPVHTPENYQRGDVLLSVDLSGDASQAASSDGPTIKIQLPPMTIS